MNNQLKKYDISKQADDELCNWIDGTIMNIDKYKIRLATDEIENFQKQIVTWLREQSMIYSSQARIAHRQKVQMVAKAKADSFEFAAREIEKWQIKQ